MNPSHLLLSRQTLNFDKSAYHFAKGYFHCWQIEGNTQKSERAAGITQRCRNSHLN